MVGPEGRTEINTIDASVHMALATMVRDKSGVAHLFAQLIEITNGPMVDVAAGKSWLEVGITAAHTLLATYLRADRTLEELILKREALQQEAAAMPEPE